MSENIQIPDSIAEKENVPEVPNVIGNLHEQQEGIDVMENLNNIETLCLDEYNGNEGQRGDTHMDGADEKQIVTGGMVPRRRRK